ncbi:putative metal chaperone, involved in Zn homeostasis, GTPase of COG0523 family [Desulfosporosinus sp. I2]|uniref:CobW family GTP-binding protein n=1 Tax=Desulfosporosinus sp. I2 TaxID=1617025 RepID=UPI0005EE0EB0|nr:GTP-binding protein [Desulfosporosinus sp. I2]KJR46931.1 putative metal chaperone, involved in Zn homeostasis, GTPase of COG0523 family [Desulfosporosinus sp. I2]
MNVLLFGGFLGSGKTSIILQVARYLVEGFSTRQLDSDKPSLVIIENEVGEAGIDDKILKAEGLSVRELFAGCICCTLNAELTVCLNEIREELSPQWVIIETTGMAFPHKIAETITKFGKGIDSLKTIVVADAERWDDLSMIMPGLLEEQIVKANIILLNKIDCLEPEQISDVEESIRRINSNALFYAISAHDEVDPQIWRMAVTYSE